MLLNFREIPQANLSDGNQDDFELFSRRFFEELGCKIIKEPSRGPDIGFDMIIEGDIRYEDYGSRKWLVSCKHNAHSNPPKSVSDKDEINIIERVIGNDCDGFIGFYSTLITKNLQSSLNALEKYGRKYILLDKERIEQYILYKLNKTGIGERYFPKSYNNASKSIYLNGSLAILTFTLEKHYNIINSVIQSFTSNIMEACDFIHKSENIYEFLDKTSCKYQHRSDLDDISKEEFNSAWNELSNPKFSKSMIPFYGKYSTFLFPDNGWSFYSHKGEMYHKCIKDLHWPMILYNNSELVYNTNGKLILEKMFIEVKSLI